MFAMLGSRRSERPSIDRAAATNVRRIICRQRAPELLIVSSVPDVGDRSIRRYPAEVTAVRGRDHAARHRVALVADVRSVPRPVATVTTRCSRWMRARLDPRRRNQRRRYYSQSQNHSFDSAEFALGRAAGARPSGGARRSFSFAPGISADEPRA